LTEQVGSTNGSRGGTDGLTGFLARLRSPYRPGQGATSRRAIFLVAVGFAAWGCLDLWAWMQRFDALRTPFWSGAGSRLPIGNVAVGGSLLIALVVFAGGLVLATWSLKQPKLADLLIETESEMKKVSWPSLPEAWGNTKVVAVTVSLFAAVLLVFDLAIRGVFRQLFALEV
jgi:preprotein translocase SecE subunit